MSCIKMALISCFFMLAGCGWLADTPADEATYADGDKWLCLPSRADACAGDFSATIISADGTATLEAFTPNSDAPFDCFYVYPTVSTDLSGNSDWDIDIQETGVAEIQAARFNSVCKVYAPIYRQVTLTALAARSAGISIDSYVPLADGDVAAAWNYYLEHYNKGRGVVLIGHSQGSYRLGTIIQRQIEGKPVADRIIAAHLIGANVYVPEGKLVGETFKHMPLCSRQDETGCLVAFSSFRDTAPPVGAGGYGWSENPALQVACVNPASPGGGITSLDGYFPSKKLLAGRKASSEGGIEWSVQHPTVNTAFAKVPGLLEGGCIKDGQASYFTVKINADSSDPRTDEIAGDLIVNGELYVSWGLHLIDMSLVLGDMVAMVERQGAAYLASQ
ncbi:DUF3089 domain-containing protein [Kordiimonas aquimaris]|uniref:DUF3089 domain-containing protein n=1 Tax=Kordiimonas aquimaris TaxID=707591 RepID=UPI0021D2075F|nr:DUF3089 domain-containing protein [Kordiimonas aquimaris]